MINKALGATNPSMQIQTIVTLCSLAAVLGGCYSKPDEAYVLLTAVEENDLPAIRAYLSRGGDPELHVRYNLGEWATPLHVATRAGHDEVARLLLDSGADANAVCSLGRTPLCWAPETMATSGVVECAELLLKRGADPNARSAYAPSILSLACLYPDRQDLEIAKLLVEHGADVTYTGPDGRTPLHKVAEQRKSGTFGVEVAQALIRHGADIFAEDRKGETPTDIARRVEYTEMVEFLSSFPKPEG